MHAFLALGGALGTRLDLDTSRAETTWRVVPAKDPVMCRLQGTPTTLPIRQWADISRIGPDEPQIECARDTVDLVIANYSGGQQGRLSVSYRLLSTVPEVPGIDSVGDVAAGGPDIRRVAVQVAPDVVRFGIDVVGAAPGGLALGIFMDTDENTATGASSGSEQGSDYVFVFRPGSGVAVLFAWSNGAWQASPEPSAVAAYTAGQPYPFVAQLHPRALADPLRIRFFVLAEVGSGSTWLADAAPSSGRWTAPTWRGYWTR
jgi:hypothetical protein